MADEERQFISLDDESLLKLGDLGTLYRFIHEREKRFYPKLGYKRLLSTPEEADPLHRELPDKWKRFSESTFLRGFVQPEEESHVQNKWALEQVRNVVVHTSIPSLIEAGLAEQDSKTFEIILSCKEGDRFFYGASGEFQYDVLEVNRMAQYLNTDVPIFYQIRAERYRPDAAEFTGGPELLDTPMSNLDFH